MSDYVTNDAWVRTLGRPDAIDDIADQFERPHSGAEEFWRHAARRGGWVPERTLERRAG